MSKKHDWNSSNIIDDVDYHEEDAQAFRKLLGAREHGEGGSQSSL